LAPPGGLAWGRGPQGSCGGLRRQPQIQASTTITTSTKNHLQPRQPLSPKLPVVVVANARMLRALSLADEPNHSASRAAEISGMSQKVLQGRFKTYRGDIVPWVVPFKPACPIAISCARESASCRTFPKVAAFPGQIAAPNAGEGDAGSFWLIRSVCAIAGDGAEQEWAEMVSVLIPRKSSCSFQFIESSRLRAGERHESRTE
jgi:hypothetical protein